MNVERNKGLTKYHNWEPGDIFLRKADKSVSVYSKDGILKKS
ncbi:uncharacterized protein METZ01_LOCUS313388 [marine metagenome]|uniref:Uncharacterized protein n=1 Tax=marine metagenome TaxID=408172 RepID=A0A382NH59_9ZZZZ